MIGATIRLCFLGGLIALTPALHAADAYPVKPIKLLVPFTAGSSSDLIARIVAENMALDLKQPVIVENRPVAGGAIASAVVAKGAADGYTILVHSGSFVLSPYIYKSLPYDSKDLTNVGALGALTGVVVATPKKYAALLDLVRAARKAPSAVSFSSAGSGSATHISGVKLGLAAGATLQHIPYRGTPEAMTDVAAGRVDFFVAPINTVIGMIKDGRLDALAVTSSKRSPLLPNVPTVAEAGVPGAEYPYWVGAFVASRTPPALVAQIHEAIARAALSPRARVQLSQKGVDEMQMSQSEFDRFIRAEFTSSGELVKHAAIQPE